MKTTILIPYQFTEAAFQTVSRVIHFFKWDHTEFLLTYITPPKVKGHVLISIDDLLQSEIERKLIHVIQQLIPTTKQAKQIKPLILSESDLLTANFPQPVHYIACSLDQNNVNSRTLLQPVYEQLRKAPTSVTMLFFGKSFHLTSTSQVLWIEQKKTSQKVKFSYFTQPINQGFKSLKSTVGKKHNYQTGAFQQLPKYIQQIQPDLIVIQ